MTRIAIIGRGLAGKLAGLYLVRHLPEGEITVVDPGQEGLPIVGESTVEVTAQFLESLGLGRHLEEDHLHKYGLTYYFRLPPGQGDEAPEYIQHEAPGIIRLPSFNLNRRRFDAELDARLTSQVTSISGRVQRVELAETEGVQVVEVKTQSGELRRIEVEHVIDCSGRARLLAKQLMLQMESPYQRSSFWFRLQDFDRSILEGLRLAKIQHRCYESYYVTHHFYGHGYWIWVIPMRSEPGKNMVSFGITYRPEIMGETHMDFDRLCTVLERDHPRLRALVLSGQRIDESRYFNYMYEARQYYDRKGRWFLLGDAGFTFDPANSAGIACISHQIPQITSIIKKSEKRTLTSTYVEAMESHLKAQLALQDQWSNWYPVMSDPVKMAWVQMVANLGYFHIVLPNYLSGAFLNAGIARQVSKLLPRYAVGMQPPVYPFPKLLDALAATEDPEEIVRRAPALYETAIPFTYYRPDVVPRARLISRYFRELARLRLKALSLLDTAGQPRYWPLAGGQAILAAVDLLRSVMLRVLPGLYEGEFLAGAEHASAFEPPHAFLFPRRSDQAKESAIVARR